MPSSDPETLKYLNTEHPVRYQAVTVLIPFRHGLDGLPENWDLNTLLNTTEQPTILSAAPPDSDPEVAASLAGLNY